MRQIIRATVLTGLLLIPSLTYQVNAQSDADPQLVAEIAKIKAVDNHAHVMRVVRPGETDDEFDAISCGGLEFISPPPMRLRPDNPIYIGAWRFLFGYQHDDMTEAHIRELLKTKSSVMSQKGDDYPAWVLDKLGIETMLANRIAMGRGLKSPRFRWVSYGDPLILPFASPSQRKRNSDFRYFYDQEEKLTRRYLSTLGLQRLPTSLNLYLTKVVIPTLEQQKRDGSIAVKFVAAYYRSLEFGDTSRVEAERIYARYAQGGEPPLQEYKLLQDFLFRYIAREAGRRGLAVHIHTGGGCGHFFNLSGSNPLLLESILNDPTLRNTNFVLIHGGYPFTREAAFLIEKPNVYADFSAQTFLLSPRALSHVLREWLEYEPEKLLFGTDASPATPEVSWEESAWLTTTTTRQALALALTEMIKDGEISRERAIDLAHMVLRENARRLYKFAP